MGVSSEAVEIRVARMEERMSDLDREVRTLSPIKTSIIQIGEQVRVLGEDMGDLRTMVTDDRRDRVERERAERKERRDARIAFWSMTVVILAALIGAAAVILTSGVK